MAHVVKTITETHTLQELNLTEYELRESLHCSSTKKKIDKEKETEGM